MIEKGVFKNEWAALCERFRLTGKKEPSQLMMRRYYRYLSGRLSTDQFRQAAQVVYAEREFFPKPADFVEAVATDSDLEALEQWELVRSAMKRSRDGLPEEATEETRRLVAKEGGLRSMGLVKLDEMQFVERRFKRAYGTLAATREGRKELPPVTEEGRKALQDAGVDLKVLE